MDKSNITLNYIDCASARSVIW